MLPPGFRGIKGEVLLQELLSAGGFQTVLDIGSGAGKHAAIFEAAGKTVSRFDFGRSRSFDSGTTDEASNTIIGEFLGHDFDRRFDCIWACHVLEHAPDTQGFLNKMRTVCVDGGWLAITVPPAKASFVGGHVSLWTPALLVYRLVLVGLDCADALVLRHGYNISVMVRNRDHGLDLDTLAWDLNDFDRLSAAFPADFKRRKNGDRVGRVYKGAEINLIR